VTLPERLTRQGMTAGPPPWMDRATLAIDRGCVERSRCPQCGRRLACQPYHRTHPREYVIVGSCQACGHAEEF
jgi:hypothetical protein